MYSKIQELLGAQAENLLGFNNPKISKESLALPSPKFIENIFIDSNRNNRVLANLQRMFGSGRLAGTGYV